MQCALASVVRQDKGIAPEGGDNSWQQHSRGERRLSWRRLPARRPLRGPVPAACAHSLGRSAPSSQVMCNQMKGKCSHRVLQHIRVGSNRAGDMHVERPDAAQLRDLHCGMQQAQDGGRDALPLPTQHQHRAAREGKALRRRGGGAAGRRHGSGPERARRAGAAAHRLPAAALSHAAQHTCSSTDSAVCSRPTKAQPSAAWRCSQGPSAASGTSCSGSHWCAVTAMEVNSFCRVTDRSPTTRDASLQGRDVRGGCRQAGGSTCARQPSHGAAKGPAAVHCSVQLSTEAGRAPAPAAPTACTHLNTSQVRARPARLGALVSREATTTSSWRAPPRACAAASAAAAS